MLRVEDLDVERIAAGGYRLRWPARSDNFRDFGGYSTTTGKHEGLEVNAQMQKDLRARLPI